ncbi:MAG: transporter substrate-binding domain-containing protein [Actinobacteria bacterium]|nr:transporter substrate-binding domain-containing protein [Actinomycetota bacterium]
MAAKLGYVSKQLRWQGLSFDQILAPGHQGFDLAISEISSQAKHAKSISLSKAYFRLTQSVVVLRSSRILGRIDRSRKASLAGAKAKPLLRSLRFGVVKASSSSAFLNQVLKPKLVFHRYLDLHAAAKALSTGEIDAVLASTPDAWLLAHQRLKGAIILGHFPRGPEGFALAVSTPGIPLRCVNRALRSLASEGTIKKLAKHYLTAYRVIPAL